MLRYNELIDTAAVRSLAVNTAVTDNEIGPCLLQTWRWLDEFITQPLGGLRRDGAVCPFVEPALTKDALWFYVSDRSGIRDDDAGALLQGMDELYLSLIDRADPKDAILSSLAIIFPFLSPSEMTVFKTAKQAIKPDYIRKGITIGEFYPDNPDTSVHNDRLFIARSPYPMYVIRQLARHDQLFLSSDGDLYEMFLKKFGHQL